MESKEEVKRLLIDYLNACGVYNEFKYCVTHYQIPKPKSFDEELDLIVRVELVNKGAAVWASFDFSKAKYPALWAAIADRWENVRKSNQ